MINNGKKDLFKMILEFQVNSDKVKNSWYGPAMIDSLKDVLNKTQAGKYDLYFADKAEVAGPAHDVDTIFHEEISEWKAKQEKTKHDFKYNKLLTDEEYGQYLEDSIPVLTYIFGRMHGYDYARKVLKVCVEQKKCTTTPSIHRQTQKPEIPKQYKWRHASLFKSDRLGRFNFMRNL